MPKPQSISSSYANSAGGRGLLPGQYNPGVPPLPAGSQIHGIPPPLSHITPAPLILPSTSEIPQIKPPIGCKLSILLYSC